MMQISGLLNLPLKLEEMIRLLILHCYTHVFVFYSIDRFSQQLKEILPGRDQKQSSGSTLSGSRFKESVRTHQSRGDRDSTTKPHQSAMDSSNEDEVLLTELFAVPL